MRFQDAAGPLVTGLGIFHNGQLVADVDTDNDPYGLDMRNWLDGAYPGCEALARCNTHPDTAAVDCLVCWPLNVED